MLNYFDKRKPMENFFVRFLELRMYLKGEWMPRSIDCYFLESNACKLALLKT